MFSDELKNWIEEREQLTGRKIDNGDGQVTISHGPMTSGMNARLLSEAADVLDIPFSEARTLGSDRMAALLRQAEVQQTQRVMDGQ